jgi:hypothetical protein
VVALVLLFINAALQVIGPPLTQIAIDRYLVPSVWSRASRPTSTPRAAVQYSP